MPVQIFVEDRYTDAYEILARHVRGDHQVRASRIDPEDLTSFENLLDLVQRSGRARFDCVLFLMDEEGPDIAREVRRRTGRSSLQTFDTRDVKARGKDIATHLDPARARAFNRSLAYFFDMAGGRQSGCDHPFPEPDHP